MSMIAGDGGANSAGSLTSTRHTKSLAFTTFTASADHPPAAASNYGHAV
jgi:hypothetical protein